MKIRTTFVFVGAILVSGSLPCFAQNSTEYELRRLQDELRILRQEQEQRALEQHLRDKDEALRSSLDSLNRSSEIRAQREAEERLVRQDELRRVLDSLEDAQKTRLLTEEEVRWLSAKISYVRKRASDIAASEISSQQKIVFFNKIWELPFIDRMTLIHALERKRWQAAKAEINDPPHSTANEQTDPSAGAPSSPVPEGSEVTTTIGPGPIPLGLRPKRPASDEVEARKRALMQQRK